MVGLMQQSHHCGIETAYNDIQRQEVFGGSNRTIVGLKQETRPRIQIPIPGSNRTIVGLKLKSSANFAPVNSSSNRTIVGLKHACSEEPSGWQLVQQSHHCGIETTNVN